MLENTANLTHQSEIINSFFETFPIAIGFFAIIATKSSFKLSDLTHKVILIHMMILAIGGHYTYAEVPLFNYLKEITNSSRNEYDKIGHFFQGITPAILTKEIILKKTNLRKNFFISLFAISNALAFSAFYEIFEWIMAVSTGSGADFVGMQGDIWDAQKDMLTALFGAVFAVIFFKNSKLNLNQT